MEWKLEVCAGWYFDNICWCGGSGGAGGLQNLIQPTRLAQLACGGWTPGCPSKMCFAHLDQFAMVFWIVLICLIWIDMIYLINISCSCESTAHVTYLRVPAERQYYLHALFIGVVLLWHHKRSHIPIDLELKYCNSWTVNFAVEYVCVLYRLFCN